MADAAQRQIDLLSLIPPHSRPQSVSQLLKRLVARGHDIDRRTLQRDLNKLSDRWPLCCDDGRPPRWSWSADAERFDLPGMDATTALAFVQAESHLRKQLPTAIAQELQPWFARARRVLDEAPLGGWLQRVRVLEENQLLQAPAINASVFEVVTTALLEGRALRLRYASRSKKKTVEQVVHPLALVWRGPVAYLIVLFGAWSDPRHLALQRIQSVERLDAAARTLPGFDLDAWLAQGDFDLPLGEPIALRAAIHAEVQALLRERPLAPDQRLEATGGDGFVLRATVADTLRLRWWLLGFADRLTVLAPERLRAEMAETVRRMAAAYGVLPGADDAGMPDSVSAAAGGAQVSGHGGSAA